MTASEIDQQAEIEQLRAQVAALERELVEQAERCERIVAEAQERLYWLERWHVDLNAVMERPGAEEARAAFRGVRKLVRGAKKVKRTLARGS
jgi:hypothetical protein